MPRPPSALWLARKPAGVTSTSLVDALRVELAGDHPLKLSHGGALDPFAEGLVVLLVGAANKLFERLHEAPKRYVAAVALGVETDTCDAGGRPVAAAAEPSPPPTLAALDAALARFVGWTDQVPPLTSNKWVDGERAYARAHRGETFSLPPARVYCHAAQVVRSDLPRGCTIDLTVRGGFYVRSLARDLGRALGVGAHLTALDRTAIGPFEAPPPGGRVQRTGPDVLPWLPRLDLADDEWGAVRRGAAAPRREPGPAAWPLPQGFPAPAWVRLVHRGRLVGLAHEGDVTLLPGGI